MHLEYDGSKLVLHDGPLETRGTQLTPSMSFVCHVTYLTQFPTGLYEVIVCREFPLNPTFARSHG